MNSRTLSPMKLERVDIHKLILWPHFGIIRKCQSHKERSRLRESLLEEGITSPIIVTNTYQVLNGNRRVDLCRELGFSAVPAVVHSYSVTEDKWTEIYWMLKETTLPHSKGRKG